MRACLLTLSTMLLALAVAPAAQAERVFTVRGADGPGPARYDRVRVIEQGPRRAHHVLVLVPGTSAGAAFFRPAAADLLKRLPGWKVWSVDRRENLLEDHSMLDAVLARRRPLADLFPYYLEWITNASISPHFAPVPDAAVPFARQWGMKVAIGDLRNVIKAARKGGNDVVLGGHSLGGSIAVAYATWDFNGHAGADDLAGLVLIDGGSGGTPVTRAEAKKQLRDLDTTSPFVDLTGLGLPWSAGVFNIVGSTLARLDPSAPAVLANWPVLPADLKAPVPATNAGGYGYALDSETSPASLRLVHMHIGSLSPAGDPHPWVDGELGTVKRAATMFSGIEGIDGTAWYHPRRLSLDGQASPAASRTRRSGCSACARRTAATSTCRSTRSRPRSAPAACCAARAPSPGGRTSRAAGSRSSTATPRTTTSTRSRRCAPKNAFVKTVIPFLRRAE